MHFHSEKDETYQFSSDKFEVEWINTKNVEKHKEILIPGGVWRNKLLYPPHRLICIEEGSKDFKRDFVHVEDVIDSHLKFLSINKSGVFNIGSGVAKSFLDVANEITDVFEERN